MAMGSWSTDVDVSPSVKEALFRDDGNPRKLCALVYDSNDLLVYPPLPLLWGKPGKEKIEIGGPSILWDLGVQGVGPTIVDREYLSGVNKLDNPLFALDPPDSYWRRASERSGWTITTNVALLTPTLDTDDVLEVDRNYPALPGQAWRGSATLFGGGRWRIRLLFSGKFDPPNLFPLLADGAWDEQVTNNPMADEPAFVLDGGVLKGRTPFPIYQLVQNGRFEDGFDYWFTNFPPGAGPGLAQWDTDGSGAPDLPSSVHYEGSGFITFDVVITNGSDVLTSATADWTSPDATGMLVEGPGIPPFSYVLSVSGPGTLQISALATEDHLAGDQSVAFRPQSYSHTFLMTDASNTGDPLTLEQYPVSKGERWTLMGSVMHTENANGSATINFAKYKTATDDHLEGLFPEQAGSFSTGGQLVLSTTIEGPVRTVFKETTIEDETTGLGIWVDLAGNTDGRWWFSNFALYRFGGNKDWIEAAASVTLTPERTYEFRLPCVPGPLLNKEAKARLLVHLTSDYRPPITVASSDQGPRKEGETDTPVIVLDVTSPSGYTSATAELMIEDTYNDVFSFGEMTVIDKDRSTYVADALSTNPYGAVTVDSVAPVGTESVRVQVVGEVAATAVVALVELIRTTTDPATGDDILADLLVHPSTGLPIGIAPGTINCPEPIPFDWRQIKMTLLAALDHYISVISEPVREFRINAAIPPTIDVSTSPFVVRPIVLLPTDLDVEEVADPTVDVTTRATEIEVIGAEVQTLSGHSLLISATATVPGEGEYDINNRPIVRTRPIGDGSIDTYNYARAFAADQALREASPGLVVDATLTGTPYTRGPVDVGDWLEVFKPESGIEDRTNPKTVEGFPIFPRVMRMVARQREHGPSFRVVMLRPDGTTFDLDVNHSEKDATKVTLADRRPYEWEADPQGDRNQFLRDWASKPR